MKHRILIMSSILLTLVGCSYLTYRTNGLSVAPKLALQHLEAYPILEVNPYLVLTDFETPGQIDDFTLSHNDHDASKIFHAGTPVATGSGSLGMMLESTDDYTLTYTPPITRWKEYNLLLAGVFSNDTSLSGAIEFFDAAGRSYLHHYLFKKGWNRLQIDLYTAAEKIDLNRLAQVKFYFYQAAKTTVYLDDLILVDHHKTLAGSNTGAEGTIFALQEGKRIRVGSNGRFELVFSDGRLIRWFDLATDSCRSKNLLPDFTGGLEVFQGMENNRYELMPPGDVLVTANTRLAVKDTGEVKLTVENFFGEPAAGRSPDQIYIWHIFPDGLILVEVAVNSSTSRLGLGFAVRGDSGFDAVIGKLRNPAGTGDSRIEYILFRRMGSDNAGADLLLAVKPWCKPDQAVHCKLEKVNKPQILKVLFTGEAEVGGNCIKGMMRVWPTTIDHLGNAEIYARKFLESTWADLQQTAGPAGTWAPAWDLRDAAR